MAISVMPVTVALMVRGTTREIRSQRVGTTRSPTRSRCATSLSPSR
jgi:hypothetical protein